MGSSRSGTSGLPPPRTPGPSRAQPVRPHARLLATLRVGVASFAPLWSRGPGSRSRLAHRAEFISRLARATVGRTGSTEFRRTLHLVPVPAPRRWRRLARTLRDARAPRYRPVAERGRAAPWTKLSVTLFRTTVRSDDPPWADGPRPFRAPQAPRLLSTPFRGPDPAPTE